MTLQIDKQAVIPAKRSRRPRNKKEAPSPRDLEAYVLVELQGIRKDVAAKHLGIAPRTLAWRLQQARELMTNDPKIRAAYRTSALTLAPTIMQQLHAKLQGPRTTLGEVTMLADKMRLLNDGVNATTITITATVDPTEIAQQAFEAMKSRAVEAQVVEESNRDIAEQSDDSNITPLQNLPENGKS